MKYLIRLTIPLILSFSACKKHSSSSNPNTGPGVLTSIKSTQPGVQAWVDIDSMQFDANNNLVKLSYYIFDTGVNIVYIDSGYFNFTLNPANGLPSSYTTVWQKFDKALIPGTQPTGGNQPDSSQVIETHNLTYDAQGRLYRDTMIAVNFPDRSTDAAVYYTYVNNMIIHTVMGAVYDPQTGFNDKWGPTEIDTLVLTGNNVTNELGWGYLELPSSILEPDETRITSYSSYINPAYFPKIAHSIGGFLQYGNFCEFLSQNLPADNNPKFITDANNRVTAMVRPDGNRVDFHYSH